MGSQVQDRGLAAALDQLNAGLDVLAAVGVVPVDARDAVTVIGEVEAVGRRFDAVRVEVVAEVEQRGLHRPDGHGSAKAMVGLVAKVSRTEAGRRAQAVRALRQMPAVRAAFARGEVGRCQVDAIGRAFANERVRTRLVARDGHLAAEAAIRGFAFFDADLRAWVRQSDEDGTRDRNQRNHDTRAAQMV
ncbi:MAG: hypothetical protein JWM89_3168, partial [Acidimicrobiales bacterium]|nr:hypothetical protein [Acidimicrobiales bacterium]